jgi:hypothetical protein
MSSAPAATKSTKSWRDVLKIHPAAELFPLLSETERVELGEDIRRNGQLEPIAVIEKAVPRPDGHYNASDALETIILDGRNRLDAREAAGLEVIDADGQLADSVTRIEIDPQEVDPWNYVISKNYRRRHLTVEQRHEIIAVYLRRDPHKSDRQVGQELGHDHKTIARVRAEQEDVGSIPHVERRTDSRGRQQPTRKPRKKLESESMSEPQIISAEARKAAYAAEEQPDEPPPEPDPHMDALKEAITTAFPGKNPPQHARDRVCARTQRAPQQHV